MTKEEKETMDAIWDECKIKTSTLRQQYQMAMDLYSKKQIAAVSLLIQNLNNQNKIEDIIDDELDRLGYDVEGTKTADFVDGFIRGMEYFVKVLENKSN